MPALSKRGNGVVSMSKCPTIRIDSNKIRLLIALKQVTQKEAAEKMGVKFASLINGLSRGACDVSNAKKIASYLCLDLSDIAHLETVNKRSSKLCVNTQKICLWMAEQELNQGEAANAAGISRQTLNYTLLRGFCSAKVIGKLAKAMGIDTEEILKKDDE